MVQLSPEQLADLRALEDAHGVIRQEIERAKRAGLDMSEYEQKLGALEAIQKGLLKEYGGSKARRTLG
jgi:hypothetical protein